MAPGQAAPATSPKKTGFVFKLIVAVLTLFVLGGLAVGAGLMYVGYAAKKRVAAVQQAYKNNDVEGMIAAAKGQDSKPQPVPAGKPAPADLLSSPSSKIPMRKSLAWVQADHDPVRGDSESIFKVDSVTDQTIHIRGSQQFPKGDALDRFLGTQSNDKDEVRKIECGRTEYRADLENSTETFGYVCREHQDEKQSGTVAVSFSRKTLNELRTNGQSEFTFHEDPFRSLLKSFKAAMSADSDAARDAANMDLMKKMMSFAPGNTEPIETPPIKCMLGRASNTDLSFPVLVNGQPTTLPAMHVVCKPPGSNNEGHLYVLDDPDNALFLAAAGKNGAGGQVIKIFWDQDMKAQSNELADQLEKNGRAKVYDLYFDFRSDQLRPESEKVLDEIAQVMRDHPDWKLSVEGNTDNIGSDRYNRDLSKRRAAAMKQGLVTQYDIAADRLSSTGFGRSHPIDTNDTMDGRARNRRVELAKQCHNRAPTALLSAA